MPFRISSTAAGGLAAAPASAGDFAIGVDVRPAYSGGSYYGGYEPVYHRGYRHDGRRYGYGYRYAPRPYYRPRPYYGYRPYRPACRTVSVRSWNGYRYVTRVRETCGRRSYRY